MPHNILEPLRPLALPIETLTPDPANARTHGDKNLAAIQGSLAKFGQRKPIVVQRQGMIVRAGNGTLAAAKALGWTEIAAVVVDESDIEATGFAIADNRTAELAEWDEDVLSQLLGALDADPNFDATLTGFTDAEIAQLQAPAEGLVDPDEVPEPPPEPITKPGDLWLLGKHRLLCGDSTVADNVARVLDGAVPLLMVTDPPYGVEYDADWRNEALPADGTAGGGRAVGKVSNDDRSDWREAWALFPGDVAYVWHAGVYSPGVADSLAACDFERRALIVWAKSQLVIGRGDYHHQHEPCWYAVRKGKPGLRTDDRKQTTLWQIDKPQKSETGHSTQKPVECMARPIQNHTAREVYDPFLGSGTTLIAAEQLGRVCYGIELSPAYCDVIVARFEAFTGTKAELVRA